MVCKKCESKTTKVATADPTKPGGGRVIGENKLLTARSRASPYAKPVGTLKSKVNTFGNKCVDCQKSCAQNNATRCQRCAYKKGLCAICGVKVLDVTRYKQTSK